jgi:hypothetical protein
VVLVLAVGALLVATPLYLLRSPAQQPPPQANTGKVIGFAPSVPVASADAERAERVAVGEALRIRCSSRPGARGQEGRLCDQLPSVEQALRTAINETVDCAPTTGGGGTLNFVLKVDFEAKTLHVFPGASGTWRGPQARRATKCVKQALVAPEWEKLPHKFGYYELAMLADYRPLSPATAPLFE